MHFMACILVLRPSKRSQDIKMEFRLHRHKTEVDFFRSLAQTLEVESHLYHEHYRKSNGTLMIFGSHKVVLEKMNQLDLRDRRNIYHPSLTLQIDQQ